MYRGDEDDSSYRLAPDAYPRLVDEIAGRIPRECIRLGTPIANVDYSGADVSAVRRCGSAARCRLQAGVCLTAEDGQRHEYDHVIVTGWVRWSAKRTRNAAVPIGFLQRHHASFFTPRLPALKRAAIEAVGFDVLEKVFCRFPRRFWPSDIKEVAILRAQSDASALDDVFFQFVVEPFHSNVLMAWVAGVEQVRAFGPCKVHRRVRRCGAWRRAATTR